MRALLLLLLLPLGASATTITPQFTQGSMSSTSTSTTQITETVAHEVYGSAISTWSGENVAPSGSDITDSTATWDVVTAGDPWQLEITTRAAGLIETIDIDRTIDIDTTTTSLSVFSQ